MADPIEIKDNFDFSLDRDPVIELLGIAPALRIWIPTSDQYPLTLPLIKRELGLDSQQVTRNSKTIHDVIRNAIPENFGLAKNQDGQLLFINLADQTLSETLPAQSFIDEYSLISKETQHNSRVKNGGGRLRVLSPVIRELEGKSIRNSRRRPRVGGTSKKLRRAEGGKAEGGLRGDYFKRLNPARKCKDVSQTNQPENESFKFRFKTLKNKNPMGKVLGTGSTQTQFPARATNTFKQMGPNARRPKNKAQSKITIELDMTESQFYDSSQTSQNESSLLAPRNRKPSRADFHPQNAEPLPQQFERRRDSPQNSIGRQIREKQFKVRLIQDQIRNNIFQVSVLGRNREVIRELNSALRMYKKQLKQLQKRQRRELGRESGLLQKRMPPADFSRKRETGQAPNPRVAEFVEQSLQQQLSLKNLKHSYSLLNQKLIKARKLR